MIIRILADNQYRVDDAYLPEIDKLDDEVVLAIQENDEGRYQRSLVALVEFIHQRGSPLAVEELTASDAILPASDMTLAETRELLEQADLKMPTELRQFENAGE
jgi:PspAA-like protein